MNRHHRFELMLATHEALPARDRAALARHLEGCSQCREREAAYTRQAAFMRRLPRELPPAHVRAAVFGQLGGTDHVPSRSRLMPGRRNGIRLALATCLLGALIVNVPPFRAVADEVGQQVSSSPLGRLVGLPYPHVECNAHGFALLRYDKILASPSDYLRGAHGWINPVALRQAEQEIDHPIWYVVAIDGGGISSGTCVNGPPTEDVLVGVNQDANTELHAFGPRK